MQREGKQESSDQEEEKKGGKYHGDLQRCSCIACHIKYFVSGSRLLRQTWNMTSGSISLEHPREAQACGSAHGPKRQMSRGAVEEIKRVTTRGSPFTQ